MKSILVVDDNVTNLKLVKATLGETYKVTPVNMGEKAVKFIGENPCDLILLDIDMPEMDGFETLEAMKALDLEQLPPVLFLTANLDVETLDKCVQVGGFDVMNKPFIPSILSARVGYILELMDYRAGRM